MPSPSNLRKFLLVSFPLVALLFWLQPSLATQPQADGPMCECEGCTSILVGKTASVDGSTITSHSCDSTTDRTWMDFPQHATHKTGEMAKVYIEPKRTAMPNDPDRV